jgi:hypothetical protein
VVGLAWVSSVPDMVVDLISVANPVMAWSGVRARPARNTRSRPASHASQEPRRHLAQITAAATARLPGTTIWRRLFFRCTLGWDSHR